MLARERLVAFRLAQGLKRAELALLLGCDVSYVSLLERGKRECGDLIGGRLEKLSANWTDARGKKLGPILASEWKHRVDDFEVSALPAPAAANPRQHTRGLTQSHARDKTERTSSVARKAIG